MKWPRINSPSPLPNSSPLTSRRTGRLRPLLCGNLTSAECAGERVRGRMATHPSTSTSHLQPRPNPYPFPIKDSDIRSFSSWVVLLVVVPYKAIRSTYLNVVLTSGQGQADQGDAIDGDDLQRAASSLSTLYVYLHTTPNSIFSYLVADVELSAPGGWAGGRQVGQHDGGQHRAPAGFHDHHAEDLALRLRHHHLREREAELLTFSFSKRGGTFQCSQD